MASRIKNQNNFPESSRNQAVCSLRVTFYPETIFTAQRLWRRVMVSETKTSPTPLHDYTFLPSPNLPVVLSWWLLWLWKCSSLPSPVACCDCFCCFLNISPQSCLFSPPLLWLFSLSAKKVFLYPETAL